MVALVHDEESGGGQLEEGVCHQVQEHLVDQHEHLSKDRVRMVEEDLGDEHEHLKRHRMGRREIKNTWCWAISASHFSASQSSTPSAPQ